MNAPLRRRLAQNLCLPALLTLLASGCASLSAAPDTGNGSSLIADLTLIGQEWFIEDIGGADVMDATDPSIGFSDDYRVFGSATCNRIVGTYELDGENLKIGPLGSTMMACPEREAEQEAALFTLLASVVRFEIADSGALVLHTDDGNTLTARRR